MMPIKSLISFCALASLAGAAFSQPVPVSYDLAALETLARQGNRALLANEERVAAARHAVAAASAYPNPEIELLSGQARALSPTGTPGNVRSLSLTQPIDLPWRRTARIGLAEAGLGSVVAGARAFEAEQVARVRLRYFELLRRESELQNAREDAQLTEGVRSRIALRVETGEAPRFELIKADAEALNAQKAAQASAFRVEQARLLLRQAVGGALPREFTLSGRLRDVPDVAPLHQLRQRLSEASPELARARTEVVRSERQLALERAQRMPSLSLRATRDDDPDVRASKLGVVVTIPLWDRRTANINEAERQLAAARHALEGEAYTLEQALEAACTQYEIARTQVAALESGIVHQAESALRVAEAAYKFGERGFIEVLDAQRVYRLARSELTAARYELAAAWVEIERLLAHPGGTTE